MLTILQYLRNGDLKIERGNLSPTDMFRYVTETDNLFKAGGRKLAPDGANCFQVQDGFRDFHGNDVHTFPFFAAQDSEENIGIFCFLCFCVSRLDKSPTLVYI